MRKNLFIATMLGMCVIGMTACSKEEDKSTNQSTETTTTAQANENETISPMEQPTQVTESTPATNDGSQPIQTATTDTTTSPDGNINMDNPNSPKMMNPSMPNQPMPNSSMPNQPMPNQAMPNSSMPNQPMPNSSMPSQPTPDSSMPSQSTPDSSMPSSSNQQINNPNNNAPLTQQNPVADTNGQNPDSNLHTSDATPTNQNNNQNNNNNDVAKVDVNNAPAQKPTA